MTTTGGPEHFLADPATSEQSDDPVVLDRDPDRLDGDDIVIEPDAPHAPHPRRRARAALVAAVLIALAATGIALAIANRHGDGGASKLRSAARVSPPAARPPVKTPGARPVKTVTPKPAPIAKPKPVNVAPTVIVATPPAATPPAATTPPEEPTSVLQWSATPAALSIKAGAHAALTVTAVNPTDGTVTLPQPLSCAPTLRHSHGATIGAAVCVEMAQVMSPHDQLSQQYTIYATNTADASGEALAPGIYVARVENLFDVKVTVTAS